jgi:hypothetical protein
MFERTRRGLSIANSSLKTLRHHPKLLLLPVLSMASFAGVAYAIFGSMYLGKLANFGRPFFVFGWFGFFFVATFVSIFFNAALTSCVLDVLKERDVSVRSGIEASLLRIAPIMQWAFYSATVGLFIAFFRSLLRRFGILGALIGGAASMSWPIVTYFVVPVLIAEGVDPEEAVKRSTEIVRRHWGTAVGPGVGIGLILLLTLLPPIFVIGYVNSVSTLNMPHDRALTWSGIVTGVYLVAVFSFFSTLGTIFRTGVYFFAQTGRPPPGVDRSLYGRTPVER